MENSIYDPVWEPVKEFNFPILNIPMIKRKLDEEICFDNIDEKKEITKSKNSNILIGKFNNSTIIIKIINENRKNNKILSHEFDSEVAILNRLNHPNIINLISCGKSPRKFMILEFLKNNTLSFLLKENRIFRRNNCIGKLLCIPKTFTYKEVIKYGYSLSCALNYLHNFNENCSIIHRDLKPDNIGFDEYFNLKIFDFGLATVVNKSKSKDDVYKMSGNTGSLRYMAPEVIKSQKYNHLIDVYSFSIILWEMYTEKIPFENFTKTDMFLLVANDGIRPTIDSNCPSDFKYLLKKCWSPKLEDRYEFKVIMDNLSLILEENLN